MELKKIFSYVQRTWNEKTQGNEFYGKALTSVANAIEIYLFQQ